MGNERNARAEQPRRAGPGQHGEMIERVIAQVEPAVVVQLVCEKPVFGFAEANIRVDFRLDHERFGAPVVSVVDVDAVLLGHAGDRDGDAVLRRDAVALVEPGPCQGSSVSGVGTLGARHVEQDGNPPLTEHGHPSKAQFRLGVADPFLSRFEFIHGWAPY